jgi:hypothetical protein
VTGSEIGGHKLLLQRTQWLLHSTRRVSINKVLHFLKLSIPSIILKSCMFSHSVCRCFVILQTINSVYLKNWINWLFFFSNGQTGFLLWILKWIFTHLHIIHINFNVSLLVTSPKGLRAKTDRLIIRYRTTWTTVCVCWKDVKIKQEHWVLLSINCYRLNLNNFTPQNEIKLCEEHIKFSGFLCCDAVSLSGSRLFEIMYYLQLQDSTNNIVNNWNLTPQHAIITYSSNSYTISNTCSNTARTHWLSAGISFLFMRLQFSIER